MNPSLELSDKTCFSRSLGVNKFVLLKKKKKNLAIPDTHPFVLLGKFL